MIARRKKLLGRKIRRRLEEKRERVVKLHEASMPEELEKVGIEVGKAGIERMWEETVKKMEKKRKVELIKEGVWGLFSTSGSTR